MSHYENPIISGCYPDPSICKANGKYYLVTSSFEYFPAIPIFESTDLVNWSSVGCVLDRRDQVDLLGCDGHGGIYAPSIRYYKDKFYVVATNVTHGGHFLVTTDDPHHGWSNPIFINQDGIDPSLFFEGKQAYLLSTGQDSNQENTILITKIDLSNGKTTDIHYLWNGNGGRYLEGPHLYKIKGFYYLLASEGGTEYGHMLVVARSKKLFGPYVSCPDNPILTNRDLGGYEIQGAGHGDFIEDKNKKWWVIFLAFRQIGQYLQFHTLGREVNLLPVEFENSWPKIKDGIAVREVQSNRFLPKQQKLRSFKQKDLEVGKELFFLRNPNMKNYEIVEKIISMRPSYCLSEKEHSPTALFTRQKSFEECFSVKIDSGETIAGVTAYLESDQHYDLFVKKNDSEYQIFQRLIVGSAKSQKIVAIEADKGICPILRIVCHRQSYRFEIEINNRLIKLDKLEARFLSSEVAGDFTGVMLGIFTEEKYDSCKGQATFSDLQIERDKKNENCLEYKPIFTWW